MSAWRIPAVLAVGGLLAFAALVERGGDGGATARAAAPATTLPPGARLAAAGAGSSTWFCGGGTGEGAKGAAEHRIVLVNLTDQPRTATVTGYSSPEGAKPAREPVTRDVALAPFARQELAVAEVAGASAYVAAVVEADGGGVLVEHAVTGPLGTDRAPCTSQAATQWTVPVGATNTVQSPTSRELLTLFNPFPDDAVVTISFSTEAGTKEPEAYQALVVPGRSVVGADVTSRVTVSKEVTAFVAVGSGRVVVDRVQLYDSPQRKGIGLSGGVPGAGATGWAVPVVVRKAGRQDVLVVANPNDERADVDVVVVPDDDTQVVDPFAASVRPHGHLTIDLSSAAWAAALDGPALVLVRSPGGLPVVVERQSVVAPGSAGAGVETEPGAPVAATRQALDVAGADPASSAIVLVNPSADRIARVVSVGVIVDGARRSVPALANVEVAPQSRLVVPLAQLGAGGTFTVVVESAAPLVVARDLVIGADRSGGIAVPEAAGAAGIVVPDVGIAGEGG